MLTGRVQTRKIIGVNAGRSTEKAYQYKCRDCRHVGWSRHIEIHEKAQHEKNQNEKEQQAC